MWISNARLGVGLPSKVAMICGILSTNSENTVLTPHRVATLPLSRGPFHLSVANVFD